MPRKVSFMNRSTTLVLLVFGVLLGAAWAQSERVLYSFCAQSNCADGRYPQAGLVFDQKGNLYGTTNEGGASGFYYGAVFKLTPKGKETVLYSFCSQNRCADGAWPIAGLVFDQKGNLYGTTNGGGNYGFGVVFKLTPKGKETVLYSFCPQGIYDCTDGEYPYAGVILDQKGNLYGTTPYGGVAKACPSSPSGCGVVFRLTPKGKETVLYSFCARNNCTDGWGPVARLIFDQKGNMYGTTAGGGEYGSGTVFELSREGHETVLHSFCAQGGYSCPDGARPKAGLVFDLKGNLYGTTEGGGAHGGGVVFKLAPEGQETVLYSFCAQNWENACTDGYILDAGVVLDQKGNLYGTSDLGGASNCGVVFKVTPEGEETVLYNFCTQDHCYDGLFPVAGLVFDQEGNLYGTTDEGGAYGGGVVFKIPSGSQVR
jgi:uncharacterized repeat protein (TIGR03803 family)